VSVGLWRGENGTITALEKFPSSGSLGWFYSNVTEALGRVHGDGEGITIGLAPYGDHAKVPGVWMASTRVTKRADSRGAHDFGMWYFWNERGAHEYHFLWHAISKEIGIAEIELRPAIAPIGILAKQCHNLGIGGTFVPAWWEHSPEQGLSAVGVFVGMRAQDTQGGPAGPPLHWLPVHLRAAPLSQRHWTVDIKIRQSVNSRIPTQSTVAYGTTTLLLFLSMANPSRIQQSVLEPATISQHVELKWGWNRARSEFWHRGTNDTYRIEKDGKRAFLKLYRRGWRSRAEIQGEVDLLRFLRRKHASVSSPISTTTGAFIDQIDTPEGRRYAVLFSEAKGTEPKFSQESSRKFGHLVASIHKAADSCPFRFEGRIWTLTILFANRSNACARTLLTGLEISRFLTRNLRGVGRCSRLASSSSPPEFGICHGDLTFGNLRRDDSGRFTLIDFDFSGYGWRSYDICVFLWSRGDKFSPSARRKRTNQWRAFLEGYRAVRQLSEAELQAVEMSSRFGTFGVRHARKSVATCSEDPQQVKKILKCIWNSSELAEGLQAPMTRARMTFA
jgi:Ser/Thr protein kinase RdoA (MazF antagonist)